MYHEVWRIQRSYFYDPNLHGVNTADSEKEYEKYLDSLSSRADLNYMFKDMLSEMTSGHLRGGGGNIPPAKTVPAGCWARITRSPTADIASRRSTSGELESANAVAAGAARPQRQRGRLPAGGQRAGTDAARTMFRGCWRTRRASRSSSRWRPMPGGRERARNHRGAHRQRTAAAASGVDRGQPSQGGSASPAANSLTSTCRTPAQGGYTNFNRYYFAQSDKQGAVIDERFNPGGQVADYIIEALRRQLMGWWSPRYGAIYRTPAASSWARR